MNATAAAAFPLWPKPLAWWRDLLRQELAPYPGRAALVARMTLAATVLMVIGMTFQLPYAAFGAVYALTISREDTAATVAEVKIIVVAYLLACADVLVGAMLFAGDPLLRLLWVVVTLFTVFFGVSASANYTAAVRFGYLVVITIPLWDEHVPAEAKVESTLWAVWVITVASLITAGIELLFAAFQPADDLTRALAERLGAVEEALRACADDKPLSDRAAERLARYTMVGTSRLRRVLARSAPTQRYSEEMGATVALVGRLVDVAANFNLLRLDPSPENRQRAGNLAQMIAGLREDLIAERMPKPRPSAAAASFAASPPLIREMEQTAAMIPEAWSNSQLFSALALPPTTRGSQPRIFVSDAFTNPDHLKFAVKGCLAASLCYVIYTALSWPGISTAVTTCMLTALTTVGASRQRQFLRVLGAAVGGLIALAAQIFILTSLDSIVGFIVFFVIVTALSAWIATASARVSYFGVQVITAFYLVHLETFKVQTSLTPPRDRVVGILLGLSMMWLVFDQLWEAPAGVEMRRSFVSTLRLLAQLTREPADADQKTAIEKTYSLREKINRSFDRTRGLGDAVWFEFGSERQRDIEWRQRIVEWQPQLRTSFIVQISLLKYRLRLPGFELPDAVRAAQKVFDSDNAVTLDNLADCLEGKPAEPSPALESSLARVEDSALVTLSRTRPGSFNATLETLLALCHRMAAMAEALDSDIRRRHPDI